LSHQSVCDADDGTEALIHRLADERIRCVRVKDMGLTPGELRNIALEEARGPYVMQWESIVTTVLCCLPLGAVGIYFAIQVDKKYFAGDLAGAQDASKKAKTWTIVSAVAGFVGLVLYILVMAAQN
jgi:Interferon-induced transmembrane protein